MTAVVRWCERNQIALYVASILLGCAIGVGMPASEGPAAALLPPCLVLLLYVTFLAIPFGEIGRAARDWRFLAVACGLNFLIVPGVAYGVTRPLAASESLLVAVLFVLLAPCIDYVIVFAGLAGGSAERLVAASPVLMLVQLVAIPLYLWLFTGGEVVSRIDFAPFAGAFGLYIVLPLALAVSTQWLGRTRQIGGAATRAAAGLQAAMVPIMCATLAVVVASQIGEVRDDAAVVLRAVPVFLGFAVVIMGIGWAMGKALHWERGDRIALIFSGVTRNSLVVLPLVLALPAQYATAPMVVVTQTLVELVLMIVCVRLVPVLVGAGRVGTGRVGAGRPGAS